MLLTDQEFNSTTYFRFVHSDGYLKQLPRNICKFNIVLIDVSYNLFEEIGNISCLQTLDTLKMNENRITFVSNKTFAEMPKLRYVDLSSNKISKLDFNILNYPRTNILYLHFNTNNLRQLDVGNVVVPNNTICRVSYKNNKYQIKISNIKNFNPKESDTFLCGNIDFSNVRLNIHPYMILGTSPRELVRYARCGKFDYRGAKYDCDCSVAEFFNLEYKRHLRYDVKVLKSQFLPIDKNIQRSWQTDVYISFDEDNDDVRWFVFQILDKFCRRKELITYIACRDSWPGSTDEQNIITNLQSCKYCLIIQSSGMYDLDKTYLCSNRMEYRLAWDLFTDKKDYAKYL
ncbi:unnamed protein product [Mytilus coruscus]|uniref:TIR domain-containing protein n=1 Tax=Mytilus coruscus TaxID=42192 RepID=A0A6J8AX77_MYTCO|nr:unnamed protein product [Mytilus coruscus]